MFLPPALPPSPTSAEIRDQLRPPQEIVYLLTAESQTPATQDWFAVEHLTATTVAGTFGATSASLADARALIDTLALLPTNPDVDDIVDEDVEARQRGAKVRRLPLRCR